MFFTHTEMVLLDNDLPFCSTGRVLQFWSCGSSQFLVLYFLGAKWAQTGPLGAQIGVWLVSKGSRINRDFAESWSGRWESNPCPKLGKRPIDTIEAFDLFLRDRGLRFDAVVIGGAALSLLGVVSRPTKDIDILVPEIPQEIHIAARAFAVEIRAAGEILQDDWLNNGTHLAG